MAFVVGDGDGAATSEYGIRYEYPVLNFLATADCLVGW